MKMNKRQLEQLIKEEVELALLKEDISSFVKDIVGKVTRASSDVWEKTKNALKKTSANAAKVLLDKVANIDKFLPKAMEEYDALKDLEKEVGESIKSDDLIKKAQELEKISKAVNKELEQELQKVERLEKAADNDEAKSVQEMYARKIDQFLNENINNPKRPHNRKQPGTLQEALDPFSMAGLALGAVGGIPLLMKALEKLANFLKLDKVADAFGKAYYVTHKFEEFTVDRIIPDKLSYAWYQRAHSIVNKNKDMLTFEEYSKNKDGIRAKVEKQMYIIMLIPFLLSGVTGMLHAGKTLVGVAEGAASTVKAIEIGESVAEISASIFSLRNMK